jgi:hypothetical protein
MKKLLLICLLLPTFAFSDDSITVELPCFPTTKLFKDLKEKFLEMPLTIGKTEDDAHSVMTFWINADRKTWTIVATVDSKSCVIGYGKNFTIVELGK